MIFLYTIFFRCEASVAPATEKNAAKEKPFVLPYSFQQKNLIQDALKSHAVSLATIERTVRLPELRSFLTFQGCNERPDLSLSKKRVQFSLRGQSALTANAGEKVYLRFENNRWTVSEKPTSLSVVFTPQEGGGGVDVVVEIQDEKGNSITTPSEHHRFSLNASALANIHSQQQQKWDVGGMPVEPILLEKQDARWYGKDEMVVALGGEAYAYQVERERIQFGAAASAYVLWVKEGDCFVFDEGKWIAAKPGPETKDKVLLRAKKIDARQLLFDLWNEDGSAHVICVLNRRKEIKGVLPPEIKIMGARSQKLWIAEIAGERLVISPTDWLLFSEGKVSKIETKKMLDEYISGILDGGLLAFSGIEKADNDTCLVGIFFDPTRSSQENVSIPLYRSWSKDEASSGKQNDEDEDDEEFFDEDDDEE